MTEDVLNARSEERTTVGIESEALIVGAIAAVLGAAFGGIAFFNKNPAIWGGWSAGLAAAASVLVLATITGYVGYWRSRHLPGQGWRLPLKPWKFVLDATTVAAVHAGIASIGTIAVFIILQLSFRELRIDGYASAVGVAAASGLATYWIYLSVSHIDTAKMSTLLVMFMAVATLTSMATAQDPLWWEYHFSQLGTFGDRSSGLFNLSLIIAGLLVTTFALYLNRDIARLVELRVLRYAWSARTMSTLFLVMGLMLAGVGVFPLHVSMPLHNFCAAGMSVSFGLMLLATPVILRGMAWPFFATTAGFFLALVAATVLFAVTGYFNLTAFELVAFVIMFGWIGMFIRFLSATVAAAEAESASE